MVERNPSWTRDELILALDLYFREPSARGSKSHPAVHKLSDLLNRLPIHTGDNRHEKFRNPNGVGMKLGNFLRYDPEYGGAGLSRGNRLEGDVWNEFAHDRDRLRKVASAIGEFALAPPEDFETVDSDEIEEAYEGGLLTRVHRVRERQPALVKAKKDRVLREWGKLGCEACGFDFETVYGPLGAGFAECHHTKPLSDLKPSQKTRLVDLAILCANCHRMIHRRRPWLSVQELIIVLKRT
jgi:5-methylcytosine-specific restriction protein A